MKGEAKRDGAAIGMADQVQRRSGLGGEGAHRRCFIADEIGGIAAPLAAVAVSEQIRRHHMETLRQALGQIAPLGAGAGRAMQQDHRRFGAGFIIGGGKRTRADDRHRI